MTPSLRRSLIAASITTLAATGLLAGCEKQSTTTQSPDGSTTTTTTVTTTPSPSTDRMKAEAREAGNDVKQAADKAGTEIKDAADKAGAEIKQATNSAGNGTERAADKAGRAIEDGALTAKVKTALLADPDVKGLQIDVDTKNGVVTLSGNVQKSMIDKAVQIARGTDGVKSVDNQLVAKSA